MQAIAKRAIGNTANRRGSNYLIGTHGGEISTFIRLLRYGRRRRLPHDNHPKQLLKDKEKTIAKIKEKQEEIRQHYNSKSAPLLSLQEARGKAPLFDRNSYPPPEFGEHHLTGKHINVENFVNRIDWTPFFHFWGFKGKYPEILFTNEEAEKTYEAAMKMLEEIIVKKEFDVSLIARFYDAYSENDDIVLDGGHRLPMLRQQAPAKRMHLPCRFYYA